MMRPNTIPASAGVVLFVLAFLGSRDLVVPRILHYRHASLVISDAGLMLINVVVLPFVIGCLVALVQRFPSYLPAIGGALVSSLISPVLDDVGMTWFVGSLLTAVPVVLVIVASSWAGSWVVIRRRSKQEKTR